MGHLENVLYSFVPALIFACLFRASANKLEESNNGIECQTGTKDVMFSREHTGVYLDPYVIYQDQSNPDYYDESGLAVLLRKVNTKFTHIMIGYTDGLTADWYYNNYKPSPMLLPKIAAKVNKDMANKEMTLLLTVRFTSAFGYAALNDSVAKTIFIARVLELKSLIDEANSVYPGTIHRIIYEPDLDRSGVENNVAFGYKIFRQIFQNQSSFAYKFGLNLGIEYCTGKELNYDQFLEFPLDTIQYTRVPGFNEPVIEAKTENLLQEFDLCKLTWEGLFSENNKPAVSFLTLLSDTDRESNIYFNNSVYFWSALNSWAKEKSTSVFIFSAFDTFYAEHISGQFDYWRGRSGWWRVIPSSSYEHPSQFQFEEKRCLQNPLQFSMEMINISDFKEPLIFNKNVGSFFNLDDLREYGISSCDLRCLSELLNRLFSSFSTLLVEEDETAMEIAEVVAGNNAISRNNMELMLFVKSSNVMEIYEVANGANLIFNGTVKSLIYRIPYKSIMESPVQLSDVNNTLRQIISVREQNKLNFKLAFVIEAIHLLNLNYFEMLEKLGVFNLVDIILVEKLLSYDDVNQDMRQLLLQTITLFEVCIKLVQNRNNSIEVIVITGWEYGMERLEEFLSFIKFWEAINSWAGVEGVKVIMNKGIDNWMGGKRNRNGWWSFTEHDNESFPDSAEMLEYKNKTEIALQLAMDWLSSLVKETDNTNWKNIAFVLLAMVAMTITTFITAYCKLRRTAKIMDDFVKGSGREIIVGIGMEKSIAEFTWTYDKSLYEIPKHDFIIKKDSNLGSGQFGIVCEATVERNGISLKTAVKMTKTASSDMALKAVLSEIKLMTYVGKHTNVVELIGAYTSELRRRKAFIFLEMCELGSLESYLRKQNIEELALNLCKWAYEISDGMEHNASKRIVHLDIATRNVLLTSDKTAKISDFGLSRRLHDYDFYAKKNQEPLPWRWMSIESLERLEFSEKSDVWAFGITLWEIYSLGEVPYKAEMWGPQFLAKLQQGLRLDKPVYCKDDNDIFLLMLNCWDADKEKRPTFASLKQNLIQFVEA